MGIPCRVLVVWTSCPSSARWIANSMAAARGDEEAEGEVCGLVAAVISVTHLSTSAAKSGISS